MGDGSGRRRPSRSAVPLRGAASSVPVVTASESGRVLGIERVARDELPESIRPCAPRIDRAPAAGSARGAREARAHGAAAGRYHQTSPYAAARERRSTPWSTSCVARVGVDLNQGLRVAPRALARADAGARPPRSSSTAPPAPSPSARPRPPPSCRQQQPDPPRARRRLPARQRAAITRSTYSAVHPEHYAALEALAGRHGKTVADLVGSERRSCGRPWSPSRRSWAR